MHEPGTVGQPNLCVVYRCIPGCSAIGGVLTRSTQPVAEFVNGLDHTPAMGRLLHRRHPGLTVIDWPALVLAAWLSGAYHRALEHATRATRVLTIAVTRCVRATVCSNRFEFDRLEPDFLQQVPVLSLFE